MFVIIMCIGIRQGLAPANGYADHTGGKIVKAQVQEVGLFYQLRRKYHEAC